MAQLCMILGGGEFSRQDLFEFGVLSFLLGAAVTFLIVYVYSYMMGRSENKEICSHVKISTMSVFRSLKSRMNDIVEDEEEFMTLASAIDDAEDDMIELVLE